MNRRPSIPQGTCLLPGIDGLLSGQLPSLDSSTSTSLYYGQSSMHYETPPTPTPSPVSQTAPDLSSSRSFHPTSDPNSRRGSMFGISLCPSGSSASLVSCPSTNTPTMSSPRLKEFQRKEPGNKQNAQARTGPRKAQRKQRTLSHATKALKAKHKTVAPPKDPIKAEIEQRRRSTQTRLIREMESDIERWDIPIRGNPLSDHNSRWNNLKYSKIATLSTHVIGSRVMEKRLRILGAEIMPKLKEIMKEERVGGELIELENLIMMLEDVALASLVDDVDVEELNGLQELI